MSKRKSIDFSALSDAVANPIEPIKKLEAKAAGKQASRIGKVQVSAFVDTSIRNRLKAVAAGQGRSLNELLEEGFDMLFQKYES